MLEDENIRFIHVPKTGGSSVSCVLFGDGKRGTGHQPVWQCPPKLNQNQVTVAFVRNPLDRLVSTYSYLLADGQNNRDKSDSQKFIKPHGGFKQFVEALSQDPDFYFEQQHLKPQLYYLSESGNNVCANIDWLCRYERFDADLRRLCLAFGKEYRNIRINASKHEHHIYYYDDKTADLVMQVYHQDFEAFGYPTCLKTG